MQITLSTDPLAAIDTDWLVVPVFESSEFSHHVDVLNTALGGLLADLRERGDLTGKPAEIVTLPVAPGIAAERVLTVGLGPAASLSVESLERALLTAIRQVSSHKDQRIAVALPPDAPSSLEPLLLAQIVATDLVVGSSGQGLYQAETSRFPFAQALVAAPGSADSQDELQHAVQRGEVIGEAVNLTRELVNRHPGEVYPETFAQRCAQVASELHLQCDIFDEPRLKLERMHALLAVARGSERPPRAVVMKYNGAGQDAPTIALVGKGVTFDSGGLSLKPSDGMKSMKADMAGAATVLGALYGIARLKLPVNVVAAVGLVENMPSGSSYKLGEVLQARNGVTIEVLNTDAEGRLVLADILSYISEQDVDGIIDLATLTGACVVALGEEVTGAFTNNDEWCQRLLGAAQQTGEPVWQMPMFDSFNEQLKCDVADVKNIGTRWGGAVTAAKFLERFVADKPWVHLDIAGPAYAESSKPHREGGGTGAMVRTLIALAETDAD
ncbi:MAG: leucyl aminopeptidase [Maioricimonas sp. JB045]|uniref:leucyl aminopeptidase n=1 Tax=Maioricimonas sp. JC845 TaxID=3232138 RepID=UPI003457A3CD